MQQPAVGNVESAVAVARREFDLTVVTAAPIQSWNSTLIRLDTTSGRYGLRLHRPGIRTEAHILGELALLRHLHSRGLRVPEPVAASTGEDLVTEFHAGGSSWWYDLTRWLEGTVRRQRHGLDERDARRLGATLADIHLASRALVGVEGGEPAFGDAVWVLDTAAPEHVRSLAPWFAPEDLAVLETVVRCVQRALSRLGSADLDAGAIHQDFILGNCLWHEDQLGVVDFADWGVGPYLYDLAPMLTNIGDQHAMREAFLIGYGSRMPLSAGQLAVLSLLEAVRHVSFCFLSIDRARRGLPTPPLDLHLPARVGEIRALMPFC